MEKREYLYSFLFSQFFIFCWLELRTLYWKNWRSEGGIPKNKNQEAEKWVILSFCTSTACSKVTMKWKTGIKNGRKPCVLSRQVVQNHYILILNFPGWFKNKLNQWKPLKWAEIKPIPKKIFILPDGDWGSTGVGQMTCRDAPSWGWRCARGRAKHPARANTTLLPRNTHMHLWLRVRETWTQNELRTRGMVTGRYHVLPQLPPSPGKVLWDPTFAGSWCSCEVWGAREVLVGTRLAKKVNRKHLQPSLLG